MATRKVSYGTASSGSGLITGLATSSTWVAGYEWFVIDNVSSVSGLDYQVYGQITVGTTPTINTEIRIYAVPSYDGTIYPDVFDGTASIETLTSVGVGAGFLSLAKVLVVDATTSNRIYPFYFQLAQLFGGYVPPKTAFFVAQNTGAALNATIANQLFYYAPITESIA